MPRLAKTLTDLAIRQIKNPPSGSIRKLSGGRGLQLRVTPTAKLWEFSYRVEGKQRTLGLGQYPAVSLPEARRLRDELRTQLAHGLDPASMRRRAKAAAAADAVKGQTVEDLAGEWYAKVQPGMAPATRLRIECTLGWITRLLGERVAGEVGGPDIVAALRTPEAEGKAETARRILQALNRILAFGVSSGAVSRNVVADLNRRDLLRAVAATPRAAITDPEEVGALIRGIRSYPSRATAVCLLLMAYTAARPSEVREAVWAEFDLQHADGPVWVIPASRTKQRREHEVPLSPQVTALLAELKPLACGSPFLFPGISTTRKPISDTALRKVLRQLGYEASDHSLHGFRTTFSTLLNQMREAADVIEGAIGHKDGSVRSRYNRATLLEERQQLMTKWADHLDALARTPSPRDSRITHAAAQSRVSHLAEPRAIAGSGRYSQPGG
jgi:integrase